MLILFSSAAVSAAEVAFFSLTQKQLIHLKTSTGSSDKRILSLLLYPKRLLASILIFSNLLNVAFITLSTYLLWSIVDERHASPFLMLGYTLTSTFLIVLFGEAIPRIYASNNNLRLARNSARVLSFMMPLAYPLARFLLQIDSWLGKQLSHESPGLSTDLLHRALRLTTDQELSDREQIILKGVVHFNNLTVKQVMKPRMEIEAVDADQDLPQVIEWVTNASHSRFPVYRETVDNIEGILHTKDLVAHLNEPASFAWSSLIRKVLFVPENKKIGALLAEFQSKGLQMAIVVDEYGGTSGLVTLEDIIEEIIGDIADEFQETAISCEQVDAKTFVIEGKILLHDFYKMVGEEVPVFEDIKGDSESLGGLLLELYGRMPCVNEQIVFQRFTFTVLTVDTRKIKKVKVQIGPPVDLPADKHNIRLAT